MGILETIEQKIQKENLNGNKKTIIIPEGEDTKVSKACFNVLEKGLCNIVFVGISEKIYSAFKELAIYDKMQEYIAKGDCKVIDILEDPIKEELAQTLYELRKHKGLTLQDAQKLLELPTYFAMTYLKKDYGSGVVCGAICSTKDTLKPALQIIKTKKDSKIVSSFFLMELNKEVNKLEYDTYVFSDCGLVENPTAQELATIAYQSKESFENLTGTDAKIALLSYSTYGSASSVLTEKVVEAKKILLDEHPDVQADGELQLDAAIIPSVALQKAPESKVAGHANVLIFPDLNAGNIGYKLVQRFANAKAYGPVCQGFAKPVNDLSRGSTTEDIYGVILITCLQ